MSTQDARIVKAHINDKGVVEEIDDPFYHHFWDPDTRLDRALEEEHYGWTLKPVLDRGIDITPIFPEEVDICTNDPDDDKHLNTIAAQRPELLKLDVGYWGDYNREHDFMSEPKHGPPQRNFGMIQGRDVWLCNFAGAGSAPGNDFLPDKDSPAGKLLEYLSQKGLNVELIMHGLAPTPFTNGLDAERLYILFPDLHLPERFPDAPHESKRPLSANGDKLRKELRDCQHEFGLLAGNRHMDSGKADTIQKDLEAMAAGTAVKHALVNDGKVTFTRENMLAEKNILDRTLRTRSCWFYGPWNQDQKTEDGAHEKKSDPAKMSAAPALELAELLAATLKIKKDGGKITVVQLGDLYELWMGREFLYLNFPVTDKFDTLSIPRVTLTLLQSMFHFAGGEDDEFQYRFDEDWFDGKNTHAIKRYPFHQWQKSEMLKRYKSGWHYLVKGRIDEEKLKQDVPADKLNRARSRLAERARNVEKCSLPMPEKGGDTLKKILGDVGISLDGYQRTDAEPGDICPLPEGEIYWHKLVFDLFRKLDFQNIHGNHDGYRSDPLLRGSFSIPAEEWISFPGIWIEHGHRWDEFNRDGCAIGAGVTNMVYYHNKSMLASDRGSFFKDRFMPQDQKCFMPGCAQWYLLVNMTKEKFKSRDGGTPVLPFGVVVMGHTHHPDLCYIRYEKEGSWLSAAAGAVAAAAKKVGEVIDKAKELEKDVENFVKDKLKEAKDALAKAKEKLKQAEQELEKAKDKAKQALADAKKKADQALADAKAKLQEAQKKLEEAKAKAQQAIADAKAKGQDALNKAKSETQAAEARAKSEVQDAEARAKSAQQDAEARAKAAEDSGRQKVKEAQGKVDQARGEVQDAEKKVKDAEKEAADQGKQAADKAKSAIPAKPDLPGAPQLPGKPDLPKPPGKPKLPF